MFAIFKREVRAYYQSPIAYAFTAIVLLFMGIFFLVANITPAYPMIPNSKFGQVLNNLDFVLAIVIPVLTMKLFADERKLKTDQLLLTAPIRIINIVIGKYLAALVVFTVSVVLSGVFLIILSRFGDLYYSEIFTAYVGFYLMGAAFIAVTLFVSSLTDSQVIAAILGIGSLFLLFFIEFLAQGLSNEILVAVVDWLSLSKRRVDFTDGVLSLGSILYYVSFISFFVFMAYRVIEKRRWSEG